MTSHTQSKSLMSIVNTSSPIGADVAIIQAPYEATVSYGKGAAHGPEKILEALEGKVEFFDRNYKLEINKFLKIACLDAHDMSTLSPEQALAHLVEQTQSVVSSGAFPFLLGGEHSVTLGPLTALVQEYNPAEVTIVQLDAHCDLRENDADYSEHPSHLAHSCVMRRAHELGYQLVQVGIRTYAKSEYEYFSAHPNTIHVFEWGATTPSMASILHAIQTKYVYITIDADGFDPAFMPATGTPVQGGIDWWYGVELLSQVIRAHQVVGADIVEVAPVPTSVLTEYGAAQLFYSMVAEVFKSKFSA